MLRLIIVLTVIFCSFQLNAAENSEFFFFFCLSIILNSIADFLFSCFFFFFLLKEVPMDEYRNTLLKNILNNYHPSSRPGRHNETLLLYIDLDIQHFEFQNKNGAMHLIGLLLVVSNECWQVKFNLKKGSNLSDPYNARQWQEARI